MNQTKLTKVKILKESNLKTNFSTFSLNLPQIGLLTEVRFATMIKLCFEII